MPVSFDEFPGLSPTFTGSKSELTGTRRGLIAYTDMDPLYLELFPSPVGGIPQLPALLPGSSVLYAESLAYKPQFDEANAVSCPTGGGQVTYDVMEATVNYKTIPYQQNDPNADQISTRRVSVSGEVMTVPKTAIEWASDSKPIVSDEISAGKIIGSISHHLTYHRVTSVPYSTIRSLIGLVNASSFLGAAAETLLFMGADITEGIDSDGNFSYQLELNFMERVINGSATLNWNYFFRPGSGWERAQVKGGARIYPTGNFSLFL
jgi:hypothetical protein